MKSMKKDAYSLGFLCGTLNDTSIYFCQEIDTELYQSYYDGFEDGFKIFLKNRILIDIYS